LYYDGEDRRATTARRTGLGADINYKGYMAIVVSMANNTLGFPSLTIPGGLKYMKEAKSNAMDRMEMEIRREEARQGRLILGVVHTTTKGKENLVKSTE
jgi:hypothetical protein